MSEPMSAAEFLKSDAKVRVAQLKLMKKSEMVALLLNVATESERLLKLTLEKEDSINLLQQNNSEKLTVISLLAQARRIQSDILEQHKKISDVDGALAMLGWGTYDTFSAEY